MLGGEGLPWPAPSVGPPGQACRGFLPMAGTSPKDLSLFVVRSVGVPLASSTHTCLVQQIQASRQSWLLSEPHAHAASQRQHAVTLDPLGKIIIQEIYISLKPEFERHIQYSTVIFFVGVTSFIL